MPYIGKAPNFGVRNRFVYLASSGATSVSGADANGATLTFTDGAYVDVYLNGVLLKPTTDYNTSTANTIAGLSALNTNDEVTVVVYDIFTVADMVSATSGGTFSGGVTFGGDITVGDDIILNSDSSAIKFGADSEMLLTHSADEGLKLTQTAAAGALFTLGTTSTSVSDDAFIGGIDFVSGSSPTVNARMHARQEGTSENGGKIEFETRREGGSLLKSLKIDDEGRLSIASDGLVSRNQIVSQYTPGCDTSATVIANTTRFRTYGTFFVVSGRDHNSSANRFVDILVASLNGSVVVVSGNTVRGSPASRSYSNSSERLNLTMGGGDYTVGVMAFDFNTAGNSVADGDD